MHSVWKNDLSARLPAHAQTSRTGRAEAVQDLHSTICVKIFLFVFRLIDFIRPSTEGFTWIYVCWVLPPTIASLPQALTTITPFSNENDNNNNVNNIVM